MTDCMSEWSFKCVFASDWMNEMVSGMNVAALHRTDLKAELFSGD